MRVSHQRRQTVSSAFDGTVSISKAIPKSTTYVLSLNIILIPNKGYNTYFSSMGYGFLLLVGICNMKDKKQERKPPLKKILDKTAALWDTFQNGVFSLNFQRLLTQ